MNNYLNNSILLVLLLLVVISPDAQGESCRAFQGWGFTIKHPDTVSVSKINKDPTTDVYSVVTKETGKKILQITAGFDRRLFFTNKGQAVKGFINGLGTTMVRWDTPGKFNFEAIVYLHPSSVASQNGLASMLRIVYQELDADEKELAEEIINSITSSYEKPVHRQVNVAAPATPLPIPITGTILEGWGFRLMRPETVAINALSAGKTDFDLYEVTIKESGKKLMSLYVGSHPDEYKIDWGKGDYNEWLINGARARVILREESGRIGGDIMVKIHSDDEARGNNLPTSIHIFFFDLTSDEKKIVDEIVGTITPTFDSPSHTGNGNGKREMEIGNGGQPPIS